MAILHLHVHSVTGAWYVALAQHVQLPTNIATNMKAAAATDTDTLRAVTAPGMMHHFAMLTGSVMPSQCSVHACLLLAHKF